MTVPSPLVDIRKTTTVRLRNAPAWLPGKFHKRDRRITIRFSLTKGERMVLRKKKNILPSEWAPKKRVVTYGPLKGSKWDNSFMPHFVGIMDASFFPSVKTIGNCKAPQTGSSAGTETMLAYGADNIPGDALVVYPDREIARKRSTDYLQSIFTDSPALRELLTGVDDDMSSMRIKLRTMLIYMGWSGSVKPLSNVSALYLVGDECNKWEDQPEKDEATTYDLFEDRSAAFEYGKKLWWISTPTGEDGFITVFMEQLAQFVFCYGIPCPGCGSFHVMDFKYIDFGDERSAKELERHGRVHYVFPCCGLKVNDKGRKAALQKGKWFERLGKEEREEGKFGRELFQCLEEEFPEKICFHSPAWVSPRNSLVKIAAAFLRGLKDPAKMHYFDNQIAAKAHTPFRQNRKTDTILALRDERVEGLVPGGGRVSCLIAGVDTQQKNFVFSIRAFGWGPKLPSWQVRHGEADTFEALEEILFETHYQDADGLYYPMLVVVIDTGGTMGESGLSRTTEVYEWCLRHPGKVIPYKGASGRKVKPFSRTDLDVFPGTNIKIPGGLQLYVCDSHHYKDHLAGKLAIKPGDPGEYRLHSETTEDFAQQMCAEYLDGKRMWQCPKNKPNHYWDCSVMEWVGADVMQLKWTRNEHEEAA